ncbi:MAG: histone deacetylase [Phycisphaeraceae bacterium]|nr:histone deacetylase [Phycisphaeraceae bacterium]
MSTALVIDDRFADHDTGPGHPERPDRIRAVRSMLDRTGLGHRSVALPFDAADGAQVEAIHDRGYLGRLDRACAEGRAYIDDPDSAICAVSRDIAWLAAGGVLSAVDAVMQGAVDNAFCAVRPPGHHAERDRSMGFCLLNNIAVAAAHLVRAHGVERVAVVDFDVHHGNGTQHVFEDRDDILFVSVHQDPRCLYPGTGFASERGTGRGVGFTLNVPMPPGCDDDAYRAAFEADVLPALAAFDPRFLLVSAGFDAAEADPLAHQRVTREGFRWMAERLADVASDRCEGRCVCVMEGGYDLVALADGVEAVIRVLLSA